MLFMPKHLEVLHLAHKVLLVQLGHKEYQEQTVPMD
jgi:hypothetical protein